MWEKSIDILRCLQEIYYNIDYDYEKMAELLVILCLQFSAFVHLYEGNN